MSHSLRRTVYIAAAASALATAAACGQDDIVGDNPDDVTGGGGGGTGGPYEDGTYTATGGYVDGGGNDTSIDVELTIADNEITAVTVTPQATDSSSLGYQNSFAGGIDDEVVGQALEDVNVGAVSGSSLTPNGFNAAVADIQDQAATEE